MVKIDKEVTEL